MPLGHDQYAINIHLVTLAGNEYTMQANLTHYEDLTQLEDDIPSFLPTVSDIDVFGCEVDLIELDTQLPLSEAFHTALLQQKKLQIIVRPCLEEGHSIWQFQESGRESYPKAVRVPVNPRKEIADRAFYAAPMLRHVEVAAGMKHVGFAAWQSHLPCIEAAIRSHASDSTELRMLPSDSRTACAVETRMRQDSNRSEESSSLIPDVPRTTCKRVHNATFGRHQRLPPQRLLFTHRLLS